MGDLWSAIVWVRRSVPEYEADWTDLLWLAGLVVLVFALGSLAGHIQRSLDRDREQAERAEQESRRG
jgi:hypothetical protein